MLTARRRLAVSLGGLVLILLLGASAGWLFTRTPILAPPSGLYDLAGPAPQPGEAIRITSKMTASNGVMSLTAGGQTRTAAIESTQETVMEGGVVAVADGEVTADRVKLLSHANCVRVQFGLDTDRQSRSSPLQGVVIHRERVGGRWAVRLLWANADPGLQRQAEEDFEPVMTAPNLPSGPVSVGHQWDRDVTKLVRPYGLDGVSGTWAATFSGFAAPADTDHVRLTEQIDLRGTKRDASGRLLQHEIRLTAVRERSLKQGLDLTVHETGRVAWRGGKMWHDGVEWDVAVEQEVVIETTNEMLPKGTCSPDLFAAPDPPKAPAVPGPAQAMPPKAKEPPDEAEPLVDYEPVERDLRTAMGAEAFGKPKFVLAELAQPVKGIGGFEPGKIAATKVKTPEAMLRRCRELAEECRSLTKRGVAARKILQEYEKSGHLSSDFHPGVGGKALVDQAWCRGLKDWRADLRIGTLDVVTNDALPTIAKSAVGGEIDWIVYYQLAGIYKSLTMAAGRFVQPDDKDGLKDVGPVEGGNWTLAQKVNHLATLIEKVEQHQKTWSETRDKVRTPDQIKATLRAETVAQLEKRLTDPYFRPLAIEALGERGPTAKSAVPALVRLLTENSSASASAKALARIKSDWHREAISLYEAGLADPDMQRRAGAVRALGYIGPPAASVLPALEKQRTYLNANKTRLLESELDVLDELNNTIPLIKGLIRRVD